jgi:hypothetical protein
MNSTTFLPVHTVNFTMFVVPFQVVLGWITNIMNIYVLTRSHLLRASACTHYFLVLSIFTFIYIFIGSLLQFIHFWFPLQASIPIIGCQFLAYLNIFLPFEITALLVLASWDRCCASSYSTNTRAWSSVKIARRGIIISNIILAVALSPYLLIWHISVDQGRLFCVQNLNFILQVITMSQTMIFNFVCPIAMIVFVHLLFEIFVNKEIDTELEPDGFFRSGPVRPASKFVRSGPVEIRPVHFWPQTGKNPAKIWPVHFWHQTGKNLASHKFTQ